MKKTVFGILAGAALCISLASCGEKLMTDAEVQAEIQKGVDAQKAQVMSEASAQCDAQFEARVTAEVDRLIAEDQAASAMPSK